MIDLVNGLVEGVQVIISATFGLFSKEIVKRTCGPRFSRSNHEAVAMEARQAEENPPCKGPNNWKTAALWRNEEQKSKQQQQRENKSGHSKQIQVRTRGLSGS